MKEPLYSVGDIIALGDSFPYWQRGWKARVTCVWDHASIIDDSRMYEIRFLSNSGTGFEGWLTVSELSTYSVEAVCHCDQCGMRKDDLDLGAMGTSKEGYETCCE